MTLSKHSKQKEEPPARNRPVFILLPFTPPLSSVPNQPSTNQQKPKNKQGGFLCCSSSNAVDAITDKQPTAYSVPVRNFKIGQYMFQHTGENNNLIVATCPTRSDKHVFRASLPGQLKDAVGAFTAGYNHTSLIYGHPRVIIQRALFGDDEQQGPGLFEELIWTILEQTEADLNASRPPDERSVCTFTFSALSFSNDGGEPVLTDELADGETLELESVGGSFMLWPKNLPQRQLRGAQHFQQMWQELRRRTDDRFALGGRPLVLMLEMTRECLREPESQQSRTIKSRLSFVLLPRASVAIRDMEDQPNGRGSKDTRGVHSILKFLSLFTRSETSEDFLQKALVELKSTPLACFLADTLLGNSFLLNVLALDPTEQRPMTTFSDEDVEHMLKFASSLAALPLGCPVVADSNLKQLQLRLIQSLASPVDAQPSGTNATVSKKSIGRKQSKIIERSRKSSVQPAAVGSDDEQFDSENRSPPPVIKEEWRDADDKQRTITIRPVVLHVDRPQPRRDSLLQQFGERTIKMVQSELAASQERYQTLLTAHQQLQAKQQEMLKDQQKNSGRVLELETQSQSLLMELQVLRQNFNQQQDQKHPQQQNGPSKLNNATILMFNIQSVGVGDKLATLQAENGMLRTTLVELQSRIEQEIKSTAETQQKQDFIEEMRQQEERFDSLSRFFRLKSTEYTKQIDQLTKTVTAAARSRQPADGVMRELRIMLELCLPDILQSYVVNEAVLRRRVEFNDRMLMQYRNLAFEYKQRYLNLLELIAKGRLGQGEIGSRASSRLSEAVERAVDKLIDDLVQDKYSAEAALAQSGDSNAENPAKGPTSNLLTPSAQNTFAVAQWKNERQAEIDHLKAEVKTLHGKLESVQSIRETAAKIPMPVIGKQVPNEMHEPIHEFLCSWMAESEAERANLRIRCAMAERRMEEYQQTLLAMTSAQPRPPPQAYMQMAPQLLRSNSISGQPQTVNVMQLAQMTPQQILQLSPVQFQQIQQQLQQMPPQQMQQMQQQMNPQQMQALQQQLQQLQTQAQPAQQAAQTQQPQGQTAPQLVRSNSISGQLVNAMQLPQMTPQQIQQLSPVQFQQIQQQLQQMPPQQMQQMQQQLSPQQMQALQQQMQQNIPAPQQKAQVPAQPAQVAAASQPPAQAPQQKNEKTAPPATATTQPPATAAQPQTAPQLVRSNSISGQSQVVNAQQLPQMTPQQIQQLTSAQLQQIQQQMAQMTPQQLQQMQQQMSPQHMQAFQVAMQQQAQGQQQKPPATAQAPATAVPQTAPAQPPATAAQPNQSQQITAQQLSQMTEKQIQQLTPAQLQQLQQQMQQMSSQQLQQMQQQMSPQQLLAFQTVMQQQQQAQGQQQKPQAPAAAPSPAPAQAPATAAAPTTQATQMPQMTPQQIQQLTSAQLQQIQQQMAQMTPQQLQQLQQQMSPQQMQAFQIAMQQQAQGQAPGPQVTVQQLPQMTAQQIQQLTPQQMQQIQQQMAQLNPQIMQQIEQQMQPQQMQALQQQFQQLMKQNGNK